RWQLHGSTWRLILERKTKQRAIGGEGVSAPKILEPRFNLERTVWHFDIHAIQAHRSTQRCKVGHGVGSGGGWKVKAAIQKAVPDARCRFVIAEAQHFDVVNFA